jgi:hypothetical protein
MPCTLWCLSNRREPSGGDHSSTEIILTTLFTLAYYFLNTRLPDIKTATMVTITTNAISKMYNMNCNTDDPSFAPIVQVIHVKHIGGNEDRYRVGYCIILL